MTPRLFSVAHETGRAPDAVQPVGEMLLERGVIGADELSAARLVAAAGDSPALLRLEEAALQAHRGHGLR